VNELTATTENDLAAAASGNRHGAAPAQLQRTVSLPMLVFYGIGVTVGAGIFALVGEIVGTVGTRAPLSFLLAGLIAGATGLSYMKLVAEFPRAGGEAVYAREGLGRTAGMVAGLGVVVTGVISSAVISLAFAGYVCTLADMPEAFVVVLLLGTLGAIAIRGVRESMAFAAVVTVLEVGALLVVIAFGVPLLGDTAGVAESLSLFDNGAGLTPVFSGAVLAFFAFVGFEDIANMAEETKDARRNTPRAILVTLLLTVGVYVLVATVAVLAPNSAELGESDAPMADLFAELSGRDARVITVIAGVAMVNGVLAQMVMASRVLYGMASDGLLWRRLSQVHPTRGTPSTATALVVVVIAVLALAFPLVGLARLTSLVTLTVFTLVNLSLFALGTRRPELELARWRIYGLFAAALTLALGIFQISEGI
jgi:amino acid transporter